MFDRLKDRIAVYFGFKEGTPDETGEPLWDVRLVGFPPPMHEIHGEIDNEDRAQMARSTIAQFNYAYYHGEGDRDLDDLEVREMVVGDFLGDLVHWIGPAGVRRLLQKGIGYYEDELIEEGSS
jgi:hypothetical protein